MFWKRKPRFGDEEKLKFIDAVAGMLELQVVFAFDCSMEDGHGKINRKAIGYIYGFTDAALRSIGQDMSDPSLGVPITYQIIRHLFPGSEEKYTQFLVQNVGSDDEIMVGAMRGGQQYVDFTKLGAKGSPMGLARYLLGSDDVK